jgi:hypothetical protein
VIGFYSDSTFVEALTRRVAQPPSSDRRGLASLLPRFGLRGDIEQSLKGSVSRAMA